MSSFVNLMADDVWSETDIIRRTEAMIRSEFSLELETILNRKVSGMALGTYQPTEQDLADMARYDEVARAAQAAGVAARADMALLLQVFPLEVAQRRLDRTALSAAWARLQEPEIEPVLDEETGEVTNAEEIETDKTEREAARMVVSPHLIPDPDFEPEEEGEEAPLILDPEAVEIDVGERLAAQYVLDAADPEVLELFELRKGR
jgi:hypothetical protein